MNVSYGKVFRYIAKLSSGECVVWRVCAEGRTCADDKIARYIEDCKKNGFYNVPIAIDFASEEDNLVLF